MLHIACHIANDRNFTAKISIQIINFKFLFPLSTSLYTHDSRTVKISLHSRSIILIMIPSSTPYLRDVF